MQENKIDSNKGTGLTGLANIGNTCFINSCIQILSHTHELNNFLDKKTYQRRLNNKYESALLIEWDNLRKIMWSQNCILSPGKFINTIQKIARAKNVEIFTGFAQNDLPEFLIFLIDCFHTSIQREVTMQIIGEVENDKDKLASQCFEMIQKMYTKEYSEIWNIFYAVQISQIVSLNDGVTALSTTPEPFFMLNLSIPMNNKSPSLEDCFKHYVKGEILEGENAWFNESIGQKQAVKKEIKFWSFPSILTIDLKRFNSKNIKNQILVSFPLENLDLSKYVVGYNKSKYVYHLYGICNHSGGSHGGHYTSFVKIANGRWYHFNDTEIKEITDLNQLVTPKAYCFFYRIRGQAPLNPHQC